MFVRRAVVAAASLLVLGIAPAHADDNFGSPAPGKHVYDLNNKFSADELQTIESKAAALDPLGAPSVVYVRQEEATSDLAQQESADLMNAWQVGTAPEKSDGFVIVADTSPADNRVTEIGFSMGKDLSDQLTSDQLNALPTFLTQPISSGGLAAGLTGMLNALAEDIQVDRTFGQRESGQHVYDQAGVLSQDEIDSLEAKAAALDDVSAPTVVLIRAQRATGAQAQQDAHTLFDGWAMETRPGARDGVAVVLDLVPENTQNGELGMYVGAGHVDSGQLTAAELQSILNQDMEPLLKQSDFAGGIGAGLDRLAELLSKPANPAQGIVPAASL
jgi:uncharacterized membrane protein YgcG